MLQRKDRNLSVVELHYRNTGEYLKENVAIGLCRFGIELKQILTITTDNGSNMLRMVNEIDDSVNELLELLEEELGLAK